MNSLKGAYVLSFGSEQLGYDGRTPVWSLPDLNVLKEGMVSSEATPFAMTREEGHRRMETCLRSPVWA